MSGPPDLDQKFAPSHATGPSPPAIMAKFRCMAQILDATDHPVRARAVARRTCRSPNPVDDGAGVSLGCLGMERDLVRGHLDLMLLAVLAGGPAHGYGLVEELRRRSLGSLDLPEGTIYPALYRLERQGLIGSYWSSDTPRRRRMYRLRTAGRAALGHKRQAWQDVMTAINAVIGDVS